jgi:3-oxoadipate enol-lactonase
MHSITCHGEQFDVAIDGPDDAAPLLLSNSLSCDLSMWEAQVAAWRDHFRVIRYNGRGQGTSTTPPAPYTMERLGRDAVAILDALGIARAHFCGLSMGGMVGMWLLTNAPGRIGRAVLANTSAHMGPLSLWNDRIALARAGGMAATVEPTVTRWFGPAFHASAPDVIDRMRAMIRATPLEGYVGCCEAIRDMDQRETIRAITSPTLVLIGARDPATTPEAGRQIHQAIPGSATVTLDTGHISAVERPDEFSEAVATFLKA